MAKESGKQVHEANRTPNYLGAKKTFCKTHYIKIIKVNNKERIFKTTRGKQDNNLQSLPPSVDFSAETLPTRESTITYSKY